MNRREFLIGGGAFAAVGCTAAKVDMVADMPLIASAPVLQNAAETSIGVSFAVNAPAGGWVEYSTFPDMANAAKAFAVGHGMMTAGDKIALVRVTGLRPATKYYYRIGADRIVSERRNRAPEVDRKVHSFTTLGAMATGSFCVINDTHNKKESIGRLLDKIGELKPAAVIWNGDASNASDTIEQAMDIFVHTHAGHPEYAADTPYMFLNGNHDFRGIFNRHLGDLMMYREPTERKPEYADLGRNFVQRLGDIALIGLDTGEDKLDTNPRLNCSIKMQPYREKQERWLAEMVETPAVKTAKFKVAFCHIPLFDPDPRANPGDVAPADKAPQYKHDFALWQRTCANLWGPHFKKAGVQLVVAGHQHKFRYDAPSVDRPWAQIVGGGPSLQSKARFPTVVEGFVENGVFRVRVHDVDHGTVVFDEKIA